MKPESIVKSIVFFLIVLTTSILLSLCFGEVKSYDTISEYVKNNQETLEKFPYDDLPSPNAKEHREFIRKTLGNDTIVEYIYYFPQFEESIDFYCGGSGGTNTTICSGFYYSPNNEPIGNSCDTEDLVETNSGVFEYWYPNAENYDYYYITVKITDNWFYYYQDWR